MPGTSGSAGPTAAIARLSCAAPLREAHVGSARARAAPAPERLGLLPLVLIPTQCRAELPWEAPVTWLGG